MRPRFAISFTLIIMLLSAAAVSASTVVADVTDKKLTSDNPVLSAKGLRVQEGQVGLLVQSASLAPQAFTLKYSGIGDDDYDVYIDDQFQGKRPSAQLKQGIELKTSGTLGRADLVRCLQALEPKVKPVYDRIVDRDGEEAFRAGYTLGLAVQVIQLGLKVDVNHRSVSVIIVPAGRALQKMVYVQKLDDAEATKRLQTYCFSLQQYRDRMYDVLKDAQLRTTVVEAMTPVDFTATWAVKNGKPHIEATVLNNCNIPADGAITYALPKGWKTTAKSLQFKQLKSGKSYKAAFDLIPVSGKPAPAPVNLVATVTLSQIGPAGSPVPGEKLSATVKLKATAGPK